LKIDVRIDPELTTKCWVGFIVWLDLFVNYLEFDGREPATYFTKFDGSLSRPAELRALTTK